MGYLHIDNLYKNTDILLFKECYATEKIHGTSAHIRWDGECVHLFSGGEDHKRFSTLFDIDSLKIKFQELFDLNVIIFGEAYGGKQQGMSATYGKELKFIVFDVKVDDKWINVPNAENIAIKFGLDFVGYHKIPTTIEALNTERDLPSVQAQRNGINEEKMKEGIVLRPLIEVITNNGQRIISKHKRDEFKETKTKREINPDKIQILEKAKEIADEWVTPMRLTHVLDKIGNPSEISATGDVIKAMLADVMREAKGEIADSKNSRSAIGRKTAILYKKRISKI